MKEWFNLPEEERKIIINQVSVQKGLLPAAIEKDVWIVVALRAIFSTDVANYLVFKGGTSLSKAWKIIERFSEDIDLGIDRSFFGFDGELTRSRVKNLRKASCKFVQDTFQHTLAKAFTGQGAGEFEIRIIDVEESDTDPLTIEVRYPSLVEKTAYLQPRILIEMSSRSLREPYEVRSLASFISEIYPNQPFADKPVNIPTVSPARTLLEKLFLLHEEFQKPEGRKIRSARMTRHLYDISRLVDTIFLKQALENRELYNTIIAHRKMLINISWIDYTKHAHQTLNFIPPESVIKEWERDYIAMQESMFYGETEPFPILLEKLKKLNKEINFIK